MKKINVFTVLLSFAIVHGAQGATFYDNINFGGDNRSAFPPTMNTDIGSFNDKVSSVKVGYNECVLLAKDWNFGGETIILSEGDHATIPSHFNDQTTGWMVFNPSPGYSCTESVGVFYRNSNRTGWTYPAPNGLNNNDIKNFNDEASSVYVPQGICIIAYSDTGFSGFSETLMPGAQYLKRNDDMTSFRVLSITHPDCS